MAGSIFDQLAAQADARREQHDRSLEPEPAAKAKAKEKATKEKPTKAKTRNGVIVNYTMAADERDAIKANAARMGLSASAYVRLACREYARSRAVEEHRCPLADAEARLGGTSE